MRSGGDFEHFDPHPFGQGAQLEFMVEEAPELGGEAAASKAVGLSVMTPRLPCVSRLLLLDGHSLAYRAFFALPAENFSTKTGQHTNAIYGFTSMLINVLRDEEPTHVAVAFDVSRDTFRACRSTPVQSRPVGDAREFSGQLPLLNEDSIPEDPAPGAPGFEADDIIATLATQAEAAGMDVLICSGDRDAMQLVSDRVTFSIPSVGSRVDPDDPGGGRGTVWRAAGQVFDLAALVGSQRQPCLGCRASGPRPRRSGSSSSAAWSGLVANVDQVKGKVGDALPAHLDQVLRNRRLNQLVRDLDVGATLEELERRMWDREQVHTVFDGLEFRVLLRAPVRDLRHRRRGGRGRVRGGRGDLDQPGDAGAVARASTRARAPTTSGVHVVGSWAHGDDRGGGALATGRPGWVMST